MSDNMRLVVNVRAATTRVEVLTDGEITERALPRPAEPRSPEEKLAAVLGVLDALTDTVMSMFPK